MSWVDSRVYVDLSREQIKQAPEYDATRMIGRDYEEKLYDYYRRRKYWTDKILA